MTNPPVPSRVRRILRIVGRSVFGLIAGVVVLALVGAGLLVWTIQRSFPQQDGELVAAGLSAEATVQRDELGIPVITAETSHDLFFAQGFVHAQDRFWEMDFRRHVTGGRLAELFGESQLGTDSFLRTLGWHEIAAAELESMNPEVREYYEAYAEGVNAYLADHDGADVSLEYAILGLQRGAVEIEPWTAVDSVAWLKAMAWDLRSNLETEIERALLSRSQTPEQLAELFPEYPFDRNPVIVPVLEGTTATASTAAADSTASSTTTTAGVDWREAGSVIEAVGLLVGGAGEGIGSNSWVVSGAHTESGLPLLANDPHLGASLPSVWHQVGLRCAEVTDACPFDVSGFSFSGVPGVIIGHNADIAWGFTNLTTDVADLYIEQVQDGGYVRDGAVVPFDVRTETITVAGGDDVELEIRSTVHGPIVSGLTADYTAIAAEPLPGSDVATLAPAPDGEYAVALRWTALQPGTTPESIFALDRARTWDDFRAAAELFDVPAQNLVFADRQGNIGYQTPGDLPIRGAGDGSVPQPGWDSAYDWQGSIPFAELPSVLNPGTGYIVTANNAVVGTDYPHLLTHDWDYGWRAARIVELLEREIAAGDVTAADMAAIQADDQFWMGKRLAAVLYDSTVADLVEDERTERALEMLSTWDAQNHADSAGAAYANVLWRTLVLELFGSRDLPTTGQGRLFLVVDRLLDEPDSAWWTTKTATGRDAVLAELADRATAELAALQGDDPARWNWGNLHTITLTQGSFGESGIAPLEWLFNRGPFPTSGGASVVNATGWDLADGYEVATVPSMRMVIDTSDWDASTWNHLTGASGHAFHPNYTDQFEAWRLKTATPWAFGGDAVAAATTHTLTLTPKG